MSGQERVLITGAQGRLGRYVAKTLAGEYRLRLFDLSPPTHAVPGSEGICGDLRVLDHLLDAAAGCDAIVHLAAIPGNLPRADRIIDTNVHGTYNVTLAAEYQRVPRIIFVSSEMALGFLGSHGGIRPDYLPVDEEHPLRAIDPYGLSKKLCEELLDVYRRRTGGEAVCLRPGFLVSPETVGRLRRRYGELPSGRWGGSLFLYTDVRDLALGILALLRRPSIRSGVLWVTAPDNVLGVPTAEICRAYFSEGIDLRWERLRGNAALADCSRAREEIGWTPRYLLGDQLAEVSRKTTGV